MNRKDIFMTGFKSKLGFSFTHKDIEEFETIIDFYEKENARLKDKIERAINILNNPWSFESGNKEVDEIIYQKKREVIDLLKEN